MWSFLFDNGIEFALNIGEPEFLFNFVNFMLLFFLFFLFQFLLFLVSLVKVLEELNVLVLVVDFSVFFGALPFISWRNIVIVHLVIDIFETLLSFVVVRSAMTHFLSLLAVCQIVFRSHFNIVIGGLVRRTLNSKC